MLDTNKCIHWLLEHGSVPVQYLTHRDLLNKDVDSDFMQSLFDEVKEDRLVKEIFSKQEENGSWFASGPWASPSSYMPKSGYSPVTPKYVTTSWILPILGDMGFTIEDKRIKKACDYVLSHQVSNGFIAENRFEKFDVPFDQLAKEPCRLTLILVGLSKVGVRDERINKAFKLLLDWQEEDGGWVSTSHATSKNWHRSCPYPTYHGALALYSTKNKAYEKDLRKAFDFLVHHLESKAPTEIQRFYYHGHSIVQELLMLSEYNIGLNMSSIKHMVDWLMSMYQDEGYFHYEGKAISKYTYKKDYMTSIVAKYRLFHLAEDDWLTYYATRIMVNLKNAI